jgi:DNA/RNA endonuclease YhcR with UshA esterase domain
MKTAVICSLWVVSLVWMTGATASSQMSIGSLRSSLESSNLELVTLEGVAHVGRRQQNQELVGRCGGAGFVLTDDTGSIEVSIRRANRLMQPVREGDHVQVTAQVTVFRTRDNIPYRICLQATDIQHVTP